MNPPMNHLKDEEIRESVFEIREIRANIADKNTIESFLLPFSTSEHVSDV